MVIRTDPIALDYAGCGLEPPKRTAFVTSYILEREKGGYLHPKRPAVIICPGGGYQYVCEREGEPVALRFAGAGCHAFVLHYSVTPARFPAALLELSKAVALVRSRADEDCIDETRIAVCGFSAGGHLAASLGVYWREAFIQRILDLNANENRPDALILGYPVISRREGAAHSDSAENLLGKYPESGNSAMFSLEEHVSPDTPPAFLWHTADDDCVSVQNSLLFAGALQQKGIPFELHIFPHGPHGAGLCEESGASAPEQIIPDAEGWPGMAVRFLKNIGRI